MSEVFNEQPKEEPAAKQEGLRPLTPEEMQNVVRTAAMQAVSFLEDEISPQRVQADKYYQGESAVKKLKGRSQVTVTKVRDGIKSVVPSVARIFTQTDEVVEFYSDAEEDEKLCADQTTFCNSVYHKNNGYTALITGTIDALKAKIGVVKVTLDKISVAVHQGYQAAGDIWQEELEDTLGTGKITEMTEPTGGAEIQSAPQMPGPSAMPPEMAGMPPEQLAMLQGGMPQQPPAAPEPPPPAVRKGAEVVVTNSNTRNKWTLAPIPPEEFIIDSDATGVDDARIHGHRRNERIYKLIEMGFTYDQLKDFSEEKEDMEDEKEERRNYDEGNEDDDIPEDPTARRILFSELYIRVDADGDGIAELRRVACGGLNYKILSDEPVNYSPFAIFKAEIQPHVFFPISLAEDLQQDQDAQTALLRSIIDNTALVNSPRTEVDETLVNLDDVKNNEIGAIIRTKKIGGIQELATPFVAGQTLPVLQYLEQVSEQRSGVTKLSQGTSSDALQSTSSIAANAAVAAADARIEMMARNIGETGLKAMFLCILRTAMFELAGKQSIRQKNQFVQVQPDLWHDQVHVRVNVGMGSGRIEEKRQTLMAMLPIQQQLVAQYGLQNPICGYNNVRETAAQLLRLAGIHNTTAYFPAADDALLKQIDDQANQAKAAASEEQKKAQQQMEAANAAAAQAQADFVKVEQQKNQLKYQTDVANIQTKMADQQKKYEQDMQDMKAQLVEAMAKQRLELTKLYMTDDRERDKMEMDYSLKTKQFRLSAAEAAAGLRNTDIDRERAQYNTDTDREMQHEQNESSAMERAEERAERAEERKMKAKLNGQKPKRK